MRKPLSIFAIACAFGACTEEVSRDITTDLPHEADQLFILTEALGESAYLGNITRAEYDSIVSEQLPGCPVITFSEDSTRISLDYSLLLECEEENKVAREGKIILDFPPSESPVPAWSMTYENYSYASIQISGQRHFSMVTANENEEIFENIEVELPDEINFLVEGTFSYSVNRSLMGPGSMTIRGKIEGINPAGRNFVIVTSTPKEQSFQCYAFGWDLPQSGSESWTVSRGESSDLSYEVSYQNTDTCNPVVMTKLPDGRSLQLNP